MFVVIHFEFTHLEHLTSSFTEFMMSARDLQNETEADGSVKIHICITRVSTILTYPFTG